MDLLMCHKQKTISGLKVVGASRPREDGYTYQGGSTDGGKVVPVAAVGSAAGRRGGRGGNWGCRWLKRARGQLWLVGVIIQVVRTLEGKWKGCPRLRGQWVKGSSLETQSDSEAVVLGREPGQEGWGWALPLLGLLRVSCIPATGG